MICNSIIDTIGNTNLIKLNKISKLYNNNIYAKIESFNPFGSIKDRVAYAMIKDLLDKNEIDKDTTILEATSGNTGIAIAAICLYFNLSCIIVMPENTSKIKIDLLKHYKANVYLTKKELGMEGSINKLIELSKERKSVILSQFDNRSNPNIHYKTTAKEIYNDIKLDYFFSTIGTGGTISGCGRYFKENNESIKVIGVEPLESAVINGRPKGIHKIQGIGAGFIPNNLDLNYIDEILMIDSDNAISSMKEINDKEVCSIGISSGACFAAVKKYIVANNLKDRNIVMIFADSYFKYMEDDFYD